MSLIVVCSFCFSLLFLMPMMMQPLSLGLCIMLLTGLSCVLLGVVMSSWYGYVLFLVYVGGLLVMFAYVSALAPNTFFSSVKSIVSWAFSFIFVSTMLIIFYVPDFSFLGWLDQLATEKTIVSSGNIIVAPSMINVIIVLGAVLLVNLLAVVKVCYYQQGPLRSHSELK
uniref:NADH-ubiquinone oxidoreductase chain 6 n=1 Tax=Tegula lividomaculata TaxID=1764038 RepID=A0A0X9TLM6_9VEST|nr:NADH dehydrogenase subunit 6 [Tegula lividomaculata]AMA07352.1 NADH dehydrogenase subunit 6 [Tegula lividomaculata]